MPTSASGGKSVGAACPSDKESDPLSEPRDVLGRTRWRAPEVPLNICFTELFNRCIFVPLVILFNGKEGEYIGSMVEVTISG
jgi:hypothetical protein